MNTTIIKCHKCNSDLVFGCKFCVECGISQDIKWRYKLCDDCQEKVSIDSKYCDLCSFDLSHTLKPEEKEETKKCPFCSEIIKKDAIKCRFCGEFLNKNEQNISTQQVKEINLDFESKSEPIIKSVEHEKNLYLSSKEMPKMTYVVGGELNAYHYFFQKKYKLNISDLFISNYQIIQSEWESIMGYNPSYFKGDNLPVHNISFKDACEYCNKLNIKNGFSATYDSNCNLIDINGNITNDVKKIVGFRLPTEAEWEFAARGGNKSMNYKYSGSDNADDVAWYIENSDEVIKEKVKKIIFSKNIEKNIHIIKQVGLKNPNELGIYDMSGNVWEWTTDFYDENYLDKYFVKDPYICNDSSSKVIKGAAYDSDIEALEVSNRESYWITVSRKNIGFRIVKNL